MLRNLITRTRNLERCDFFPSRSQYTMAESPLILRLIASSVTAANRAGKIIRDIMSRGDLGIVEKAKNDLQTEADRSAQRCIIASLSLQFPSVTIIGEEGASNTEVPSDWIVTDSEQTVLGLNCPEDYKNVLDSDIVMWVDPLDGTSEYTQGLLDHVTVLIGVSLRGRAVGGVIHQPYYNYTSGNGENLGRTLWGLVDVGIGGFTPQPPPANRLIVTTTRSHSDQTVQAALDAMNPDEVIRVGGAGHKVMLLLEGRAHAYVFASGGCKKWDTCGPEAVLVAAGGHLTTVHGHNYDYGPVVERANAQGVFATAPGVDHDALLAQLPPEVLDALN
ncbi:uncharacterized protein CBL_04438 [Carabus blaptoides fortunei]